MHVGVVLMVNMAIGLASPPVGACIAVVSTVTGVSYAKLCRALIPFILVEIAVLAVIVLVPELTLFLPRSLGLLDLNP